MTDANKKVQFIYITPTGNNSVLRTDNNYVVCVLTPTGWEDVFDNDDGRECFKWLRLHFLISGDEMLAEIRKLELELVLTNK